MSSSPGHFQAVPEDTAKGAVRSTQLWEVGRVVLNPLRSFECETKSERSRNQTAFLGRLAAWTHSGVNETGVEDAGVTPALSGMADTKPFPSTPGHVENTGYYANQTQVNSRGVNAGKPAAKSQVL